MHILREVSQKTCLAFSLVFCSKKWSSECALFPVWGAYFANGREILDVFSRFFFGPEFLTFLSVTCRKSRFYVFSLQFYSTWICVYFAEIHWSILRSPLLCVIPAVLRYLKMR